MITKNDLSRVYYLAKELEMWKRRLQELEADIPPNSKPNDGMPHSQTNAVSSPTESKAIALAELTRKIREQITRIETAKMQMETLIVALDDPILKQVIEYHCIRLMSWKETAAHIGGCQTPEGVRQMYSRYCKTLSEEEISTTEKNFASLKPIGEAELKEES